jgi:hypothetical protein
MKWRSATAAAFLRCFLQTQPSSPNGALRIQTHHSRAWHVRHGLFSLEGFRAGNEEGKILAAELRQKHRVNGSNRQEFALWLPVCQEKMWPTTKIIRKDFLRTANCVKHYRSILKK